MRIALVHPTYWPEVRRGSERVVHDLGVTLAGRGHEVTVITSHRGPATTSTEDGVRVIRARRPPDPPGSRAYEYHLVNGPNVAFQLKCGDYDVVHAFFPLDAWVAVQVRRRGGPPVVATLHGIPTREYLVARRHRLEMLRAVAAGADECTVLSEAAADPFRRYLLREPKVLPPGVLTEAFDRGGVTRQSATFFCPASLGDPRKRGELLIGAFELVRRRMPQARLLLAGGRDPVMSPVQLAITDGIEMIEADSTTALALAYASASATVLPRSRRRSGSSWSSRSPPEPPWSPTGRAPAPRSSPTIASGGCSTPQIRATSRRRWRRPWRWARTRTPTPGAASEPPPTTGGRS